MKGSPTASARALSVDQWGRHRSDLVAIAYPGEGRASEVMDAIKRLDADGTIDLEDAVAVAKDGEGRVKVEGAISRTTAGTAGGLFLGTLLGLVFFAPVVGALFGTASGALTGKLADEQRIDDFVLEVGDNVPPGSSAILMLVRQADPDKALAELRQYGGKVIRTTLPDDAEARIRAALGQPTAGAALRRGPASEGESSRGDHARNAREHLVGVRIARRAGNPLRGRCLGLA